MRVRQVWTSLTILSSIIFLCGCASAIAPRSDSDSLLLVLIESPRAKPPAWEKPVMRLEGPSEGTLTLDAEDTTLRLMRCLPGEYQVSVSAASPAVNQTLRVESGSIVLFPRYFRVEKNALVARPVAAAEQEQAAKLLLDHIGIQDWLDRRYAGFGSIRPKMYLSAKRHPLTVITDPPGALVSIDKTDWGESPQHLEMAAGKYYLQVEKSGYLAAKEYINLDGPREINIALEKIKVENIQPKKQYFIMTYPFLNLADPDFNPFGTVFQGSIKAIYGANRRFRLVEQESQTEAAGSPAEYPDLNLAEEKGAELAIAGKYRENNNELFVHAVLYDVKSRRVKTAVVYTGEAGFAIFTTIDEISREIAQATDMVLPSGGQPVVEEEVDPRSTLVAYEKELFKERVIDDYAADRHLLCFALGGAGMLDAHQEATRQGPRVSPFFPINTLDVSYEILFSPELSLQNSLTFSLQDCYTGMEHALTFDLFLNTGPKLNFRSEKSEISVAALLSAGFTPALTVLDGMSPVLTGPYFFLGARLGIGCRYYLHERLSERPYFLGIGLMLDVAMFRFNFKGYSPLYVPMSVLLSVGGGFAL